MSLPPWCRAAPTGTRLEVLVQPRAAGEGLGPVHGDRLKVRVHAPPVDDAANAAVVRLVARGLGVPAATVSLAAGRRSRRKALLVEGLLPEAVVARLSEAMAR